MDTVVVRYRPLPERAEENQQLVEKVFAELEDVAPDGLRYMTFRLDDGTFVHVAQHEGDNPLVGLGAFAAFTAEIGDRCAEGDGPNAQPARIVGSYGWGLD